MFENCLIQGILIDSHVLSPLGSQLKILITLQIFEKIRNGFRTCLLGPEVL
jgi:hypothetical protein